MRPPAAPHLLAALRSRMATRSRVALRTSVRAVDATSGELLWEYDPRVRDHARRMQAGWDHNRGIAYYKGRIYAATWDGRLNAIDAATGKEVWSTMTVDAEGGSSSNATALVLMGVTLCSQFQRESQPH